MSEEKQCPFELGQCVKHRSSGEPGVIVGIETRCATHSGAEHLNHMFAQGKVRTKFFQECNQVYHGMVTISTGFNVPDIEVEDFRLAAD